MKFEKIKDKIEILDVKAQGCKDDCEHYTNAKTANAYPNVTEPPAINLCGCSSKKLDSDAEITTWW